MPDIGRETRRPGFTSLANVVGEMLQQASKGEKEQQELLLPMVIGISALAIIEAMELKHEADIPRFFKA
jgi:hypothetical protein